MTTMIRRREVNWCSKHGTAADCYGQNGDPVFIFDPEKVNLPLLLLMSGMYPTYRAALADNRKGKIQYGWDGIDGPGVTVYIWNPDPGWYKSDPFGGDMDTAPPDPTTMQQKIESLIMPSISVHDPIPPWSEEPGEMWIDGLPFDCPSLV